VKDLTLGLQLSLYGPLSMGRTPCGVARAAALCMGLSAWAAPRVGSLGLQLSVWASQHGPHYVAQNVSAAVGIVCVAPGTASCLGWAPRFGGRQGSLGCIKPGGLSPTGAKTYEEPELRGGWAKSKRRARGLAKAQCPPAT